MATPVQQGQEGFSQKWPNTIQASYYNSRPQLLIEGEYQTDGAPEGRLTICAEAMSSDLLPVHNPGHLYLARSAHNLYRLYRTSSGFWNLAGAD